MPFFTKHVGKNAYTWNGVKKVPSAKVWFKTWNHKIDTQGSTGGNTFDTGIENWITPSTDVPMNTSEGWYGYGIGMNGKIFASKNRGSRSNPGGIMYDPASGASGDIDTLISNGHAATFDCGVTDQSGNILPDGRLFFVDADDSDTILLIDPETLETETQAIDGVFRASSAARHPNGKIYGVSADERDIYELNPETWEGKAIYALGSNNRSVTVMVGASEKLYILPLGDYGTIYDTKTGVGVTFGEPSDGSSFTANSFYKGALAPNGCIYIPGRLGSNILKINTYTDEISYLSGNESRIGTNVGHNGKVYSSPYGASTASVLDPDTDTLTSFGSFSGSFRYHLGPPCFDGSFICPHFYNAGDFGKLIPSGGTIPEKFSYSPWLNRY